jgi:uncharacterized protein
MTRPIVLLARLNEIDLSVDALKARLHDIAEALREPAAIAAARRDLAAAEAAARQAAAAQKDAELVQAEAAGKLARAETALYSDRTRSSRQVADEEHDMRQQRSHLAQAEERLLEAMIASEEAAGRLAESQAEVARLSAEWKDQQASLVKEQAQLKARLAGELAKQAAARQVVPPGVLVTYDNLRPRRAGRAVAQLEGDECSACRVAVPPSKLPPAREGDQLVYCGNCGRLIWDE